MGQVDLSGRVLQAEGSLVDLSEWPLCKKSLFTRHGSEYRYYIIGVGGVERVGRRGEGWGGVERGGTTGIYLHHLM